MTAPAKRAARSATVTATTRISPDLIRLSFDCPGIIGVELPYSDHYVKLLFVPEGADYSWPFDLAEIRETRPREMHPVTRTYTLCNIDTVYRTCHIDFAVPSAECLSRHR